MYKCENLSSYCQRDNVDRNVQDGVDRAIRRVYITCGPISVNDDRNRQCGV